MERRHVLKMLFGAAGAVLIAPVLGQADVEAAVFDKSPQNTPSQEPLPQTASDELPAEIKAELDKSELDYAQYYYRRRRRVYRRRYYRRPVYRRRVVRRRRYYRRVRYY